MIRLFIFSWLFGLLGSPNLTQEICLTNLQTVMPQYSVGGGDMKINIGKHKVG
jgi:hypothetical protein